MPPTRLLPERQDGGSPRLGVLVSQWPFSQAAGRDPRRGVTGAQTSQTPPAEPLQSGYAHRVARTGCRLATKPPPPGEGAPGALRRILVLTCSCIYSFAHSFILHPRPPRREAALASLRGGHCRGTARRWRGAGPTLPSGAFGALGRWAWGPGGPASPGGGDACHSPRGQQRAVSRRQRRELPRPGGPL